MIKDNHPNFVASGNCVILCGFYMFLQMLIKFISSVYTGTEAIECEIKFAEKVARLLTFCLLYGIVYVCHHK